MPSSVALVLCLVVIAVGLLLERRDRRSTVTAAAWLPCLWVMICASRSVGQWLGVGSISRGFIDDAEYLEATFRGSPIDQVVLGAMIVVGLVVIWGRSGSVRRIVASNKWLLALVIYLGVSVAWSDIEGVSLRRWFRLFGHIVMAGVLVSEPAPIEAVRSVLRRCGYVLIPLSVLFVKYYQNLGVLYSTEGKRYWVGVAIAKNGLAHLALVFTIALIWDRVTRHARSEPGLGRLVWFFDAAIVISGLWLMHAGGFRGTSATATVCLALALGILVVSRASVVKRNFARSGTVIVLAACLFFAVESSFGIVEPLVNALGRNMTFTDRVPLWNALVGFALKRPLAGYGYGGFWTPGRAVAVAASSEAVTEAHNGYLETLLAGGAIAIVLLAITLAFVLLKIERNEARDYDYNVLRLSFFAVLLVANVTESSFLRERDLMTILFFVIAMNDGVALESWRSVVSKRVKSVRRARAGPGMQAGAEVSGRQVGGSGSLADFARSVPRETRHG